MTAIDQFDPFEQRITGAIGEIAAPRRPAYLDDILRQTAGTSQRPRWSFPGRWLPMDTTFAPTRMTGRIPARPMLLVLVILLLTAVAAITFVGSRNRVAPPFGLAANGQIVFAEEGDLWVSDSPGDEPRLLVADGGIQRFATFSPNGELVAYPVTEEGGDRFWVVGADGSNPHPIHDALIEPGEWAWAGWSPDSRTIAIGAQFDGQRRLLLAAADASGVREVDVAGLLPWDLSYDPRDPDRMIVRAQAGLRGGIELFAADGDGAGLAPLGLLTTQSIFGPATTLAGHTWSPAEDVIAYNAADIDPLTKFIHWRVHLVNSDGTGDHALPGPADPTIHEAWPVYSPDGKWLLVTRSQWEDDDRRTSGDVGDGWLAIMPADGSEPARDIGPRLTEGDVIDVLKSWSPDGSHVLMQTEAGDVFVVDPFANTWEAVPFTSALPDWQRRAP